MIRHIASLFPVAPARVRWLFAILVCGSLFLVPRVDCALAQSAPGDCLSQEEALLAVLVNEYRQENDLDPVPVTVSLTEVAQWHVWDLDVNHPYGGECTAHSWSDQGPWTPVCYTSDGSQAEGMWYKPREITENVYLGYGFEIAYGYGGIATAENALNAFKNSPAHNDVILNQGPWASYDPWPAMGIGMRAGFAVIWFGSTSDPQGLVEDCNSTSFATTTWGGVKALYR